MKRKRRRPVTAPSYPSLLTVYIGNLKKNKKNNSGVVVGRASHSRCSSLLRRAGFRLWLHFFWNHTFGLLPLVLFLGRGVGRASFGTQSLLLYTGLVSHGFKKKITEKNGLHNDNIFCLMLLFVLGNEVMLHPNCDSP